MLNRSVCVKSHFSSRYHTLNLVAISFKTKVPNEPRGSVQHFNGVVRSYKRNFQLPLKNVVENFCHY